MAPVILVTNDDGIHARGLAVLAEALAAIGEVYVVAPDREQSAVGHALTLHRPLRVDKVAERKFAVNGTPSDCVNLAVLGVDNGKPEPVATSQPQAGVMATRPATAPDAAPRVVK